MADGLLEVICSTFLRCSLVPEKHRRDILNSRGKLERVDLDPSRILRIVKAADRFHNHSSMGNAFTIAKQLSYLVETEELVLPMIKIAARAFPLQEAAFENAKLALRSQISLARPALEMCALLSAKPLSGPKL